MTTEKKKKKAQQQQQAELIGSADYIASHEIDQIIKKGRDRIKHAITVSDVKLTKTKKQIIKEMAMEMEQAGYPVNQICDRLTKSLIGLVHKSTVSDALEAKYKDPVKRAEGLQNYGRSDFTTDQQQLIKKPVQEITLEDISKGNFPKSKLKQVVKHQMQRADWWEQQAKQNEAKAPPTTTKQEEDKDKTIADLKREIEAFKTVPLEKFETEIVVPVPDPIPRRYDNDREHNEMLEHLMIITVEIDPVDQTLEETQEIYLEDRSGNRQSMMKAAKREIRKIQREREKVKTKK